MNIVVRLCAAEPVYVVVTVSVTPVGKVVIHGVPGLSRDAVTVFETVVLEHLDPVGDGLEDLDRVDCAVALWLTDKRPVAVRLSLDVTVLERAGVEEALVLALKEAEPEAVFVVDMDAVAVLDLAEEDEGRAEAVSTVVELATDVRLGAPEGVRVCIVLAVSV